jgi:hypothetical protein
LSRRAIRPRLKSIAIQLGKEGVKMSVIDRVALHGVAD